MIILWGELDQCWWREIFQDHWSNSLFDGELFTAFVKNVGPLVKGWHFQGWCFHELCGCLHSVLHYLPTQVALGELGQRELIQSLCKSPFFQGFWLYYFECSPIVSRWLQGFREFSYLKVPSFPEFLVDGLIGCQHDEAWDHEIERG